MNIKEVFDKYDDEFLKFENCTEKPFGRADMCAFAILDRLVPRDEDMISSAEHDQVFLSVDTRDVERVASEEDIANLMRCGVIYDESADSFFMFV
jgi:hypothetical protein